MKKFYSEPELIKFRLESVQNIADLSLGGALGEGDEWTDGDEDGDTID